MSTTGKLITVAGIDGAGKSTLAAALHAAFTDAGHEAILASKHSVEAPGSTDLSAYLDSLRTVVYKRDAAVGAACGDHYWLFALAAWYTLQERLIIGPALQAGAHVIVDNAHHKILARYGASPEVPAGLARHVFAHLRQPDLVLYLQITAIEALQRKKEFTALESGRTGATRQAFISYQDTVTTHLDTLAAAEQWSIIDVTNCDREAVLDQALGLLAHRLNLRLK